MARGVYSMFEEPRSGQNQYTQKFRAQAGSWSIAYTESSKISGPGQNLYTQKFRPQAGSWSIAYTESSKSPDPGRISILKFSGSREVPAPGVYRRLENPGPRAKSVYSKIPGPGRFLIAGVYLYT